MFTHPMILGFSATAQRRRGDSAQVRPPIMSTGATVYALLRRAMLTAKSCLAEKTLFGHAERTGSLE